MYKTGKVENEKICGLWVRFSRVSMNKSDVNHHGKQHVSESVVGFCLHQNWVECGNVGGSMWKHSAAIFFSKRETVKI